MQTEAGTDQLEATGTMRPPLRMSSHQSVLLDELTKKDPALARMYRGSLTVLADLANPDRLALAAHSIRELMEKLPRSVDVHSIGTRESLRVVAQRASLYSRVSQLQDSWARALEHSRCHRDGRWAGKIDGSLTRFLRAMGKFSTWYRVQYPRRKESVANALQGLDDSDHTLPSTLIESRVERWDRMWRFFQNVSHHQQVAEEEEFANWLGALERFLLDALRPRPFADFDAIDKIVEQGSIEPALEQMGKRAVNYEYLFTKLQTPDWIEPLAASGLLHDPPAPVREGDYIRFPFWPESQYLARMASVAPELVLRVALAIPETENPRVYDDMADMALAMPAGAAAGLAPRLRRGLELPHLLVLPDKLGKLVAHLALGNRVAEALDLARGLLAVLPDPRMVAADAAEGQWVFRPEPRPRFHLWEYGEILKDELIQLTDTAGIPTLVLLCDLLETALRLSERPGQPDTPRDASSIWRPEISVDEGPPPDLKNTLVSAVRDVSERLIGTSGPKVLSVLARRPYDVFTRIALHLRRHWPDIDPETTEQLVQTEDVFHDIELWHELYHLLKEQFGRLSREAKEGYLALVAKGPSTVVSPESSEGGPDHRLAGNGRTGYIRHWQYRMLIPIQQYLQGAWRELYEDLAQEFGEMAHPDFHYFAYPIRSGPTSPLSREQIEAMRPDDLVVFLASWEPSEHWTGPSNLMSPTPDGLGSGLVDVVGRNPEPYATQAELFRDLEPTYVRGLVTGLEKAATEHRVFSWSPVLRLCRWVLAQPREISGRSTEYADIDPGWGWTRKAIASLLSAGLERGACEIPCSSRTEVWAVLLPLTEDPDPTPEYEARYGGANLDPATLSINTTRGEAMHAVVRFALWARRNAESARAGQDSGSGFAYMPEVRKVLDRHLDPSVDSSAAVRSVYGRWFPWLDDIDSQWAQSRVPLVFPADDQLSALRDAAWNAYVTFCPPFDNALKTLGAQYSAAIDRMDSAPENAPYLRSPNEHLAEHLMAFYWRGKLSLSEPDGLMRSFLDASYDALHGYALAYIGRSLHNTAGPLPERTAERLIALWEDRYAAAQADTAAGHGAEMAAFGWWFCSAKFDPEWSMSELLRVLSITTEVEADNLVASRLAALSPAFPLDCVVCLTALVESASFWALDAWGEHARTILSTGLAGDDTQAREAAVRLINRLGARGYLKFGALLEGNTS